MHTSLATVHYEQTQTFYFRAESRTESISYIEKRFSKIVLILANCLDVRERDEAACGRGELVKKQEGERNPRLIHTKKKEQILIWLLRSSYPPLDDKDIIDQS